MNRRMFAWPPLIFSPVQPLRAAVPISSPSSPSTPQPPPVRGAAGPRPLHLEQRRNAAGSCSSSSGHAPLHPTTNRHGPANSDPALVARGPAAPARRLASPPLPRRGCTTSRPHGRLASTSFARRPGIALRSLRLGTQPRFGAPPSTSGRSGRDTPSSISWWPWRNAFSSYHGTFWARRIDRRRGGACRRGGALALTRPTARWIDTTPVALFAL
jgi:hypothetical protein